MTGRIPEPPSMLEAEGIPDFGDATPEQAATGDTGYGLSAPSVILAADDFGTTAAEMHDGEPLDGRLERELPDVLDAVDLDADESVGADTPFSARAGQGVGRLVDSDDGSGFDTEADLVARDVGTDLGGYSAEEAAMHLEPEV